MTQRTDQIGSVLRRALQAQISRGLADPRVRGLISITGVSVSPDLADATVRVSVVPAEHEQLTLHGLRHAASHLRARVKPELRLRRVPRLHFQLDPSIKRQAELDAAIRDADGESDGPGAAAEDSDS